MAQAVEAYRGITATEEFKYLEILRTRTKHDEAQALMNARRKEREHWQDVVADKDALIADRDVALADRDVALADKDAIIAELRAQLEKQ